MNPQPETLFGPVIHSYTRADAIEDGVLVDLMQEGSFSLPLVKEAGFKYPVAMTIGAFTACICNPDNAILPPGQDVTGRLWDVLWMLSCAIKRTADGDTIAFEVLVWNGRKHDKVRLWSRCGPGDTPEPVITIMLQGED